MKHRHRLSRRQARCLKRLYADYFADSFEYCEAHLEFLRRRRDSFLSLLKAQ